MKCKDIPIIPILKRVYERRPHWCCTFGKEFENSIRHAFPENVNDHIVLAKMTQIIKNGLLNGCTCGCRGDFEITEKGIAFLKSGMTDIAEFNNSTQGKVWDRGSFDWHYKMRERHVC